MKLAIAQLNCVLGDLAGNAQQILGYADQAKAAGAELLLTPELSLCGYPPDDLLLRDGFCAAVAEKLHELASKVHGITVLVGHPELRGEALYNAASVLQDGRIVQTYLKHELPNYAVFDEKRYFSHGISPCVFELGGVVFGVNICADIWEANAARMARDAGAQVLLVLNASPFATGKQSSRYRVAKDRVAETGMPLIYANMVGGQDELVFDGGSFALDGAGRLTMQAAHFEAGLVCVELDSALRPMGEQVAEKSLEATIYEALCLGVRDYVGKNRFPGILLGLSGGIDSALTLAIAHDALGADKVHAVMMPSPYTAQISLDDSREMIRRLGVKYDEYQIDSIFQNYLGLLAPAFSQRVPDTTEENLQARIRGALLMALSNKFGSIVLTTGNKSEMAVGYATLYGDMAGGFAVLKDVSKTMVYRLSRYRNTLSEVIPERIITRPPSAELRADQTDQDSLPPYDILDAIMAQYVEQNQSIDAIIAQGFDERDVRRVVHLIRISEYKRRQSAVGIRITERSYGKDWRYPITVKYQDSY
ncbi:MAG: NAD+ synthase [Gallionella sp.]|nr:NAD+ synthase [Gallionella sp.]